MKTLRQGPSVDLHGEGLARRRRKRQISGPRSYVVDKRKSWARYLKPTIFFDPCIGCHISSRAGIKFFGGIFFARDLVKVDIRDTFALDTEDCWSTNRSTICDNSPLPQNEGIVFNTPSSTDTAFSNNAENMIKSRYLGTRFCAPESCPRRIARHWEIICRKEGMMRGPSLTLSDYSGKMWGIQEGTYDMEDKADNAEKARSLSFIEERT